MDPIRILRWEGSGFLLALGVLLAHRMLTGRINLGGLLRRKTSGSQVSPERVQLLLTTLFLSVNYLDQAVHANTNALPDISPQMLYIFGASSSVYASVKAWTHLRNG